MDKRKIYCDFDNTIINATKIITDIYNSEFQFHPKFKPAKWYLVDKYDFSDQCPLLKKEMLMNYFDSEKFFDNIEYMENAYEILLKLSDKFDIFIISLGNERNLELKDNWIKENIPFIKGFIPCNFNKTDDKSHIDMSDGGILIDDCSKNLFTSSASLNILYGDSYSWNNDWDGIHKWNWYEVYDFLVR